jgi:hypothetical protein
MPRKRTVDALLAAFKSLGPAEQDEFMRRAHEALTATQQLYFAADVTAAPEHPLRDMIRASGAMWQMLRRHHPRTQAERDAEIVDRLERGEKRKDLLREYAAEPHEMDRDAFDKAVSRERRRRKQQQAG